MIVSLFRWSRRTFARVSRRVRLGSHFLGVFVPHDVRGDKDAVRALAPRIMRRTTSPPVCVVLEEALEGVGKLAVRAGLPGPPQRLVLFAHPNEAESAFAVNPGASLKRVEIPPAWWQSANHRYDFVYAHVCNGASVLERDVWASTFPQWVSYKIVVGAFIATARAEDRWTEIGSELLVAAWESDNVDALYWRIKETYSAALARLYNTFDSAGGDDITMVLIEKSLAGLAKRPA